MNHIYESLNCDFKFVHLISSPGNVMNEFWISNDLDCDSQSKVIKVWFEIVNCKFPMKILIDSHTVLIVTHRSAHWAYLRHRNFTDDSGKNSEFDSQWLCELWLTMIVWIVTHNDFVMIEWIMTCK